MADGVRGDRDDDQLEAQGGPGTTTIAPRVIEHLAVAAARELDGTRKRRDGVTGFVRGGLPRASAVVAGSTSRVRVEIAAPWQVSLPELAGRVRDHVAERVGTLSGYDVAAVDVRIASVVANASSRRVQ